MPTTIENISVEPAENGVVVAYTEKIQKEGKEFPEHNRRTEVFNNKKDAEKRVGTLMSDQKFREGRPKPGKTGRRFN